MRWFNIIGIADGRDAFPKLSRRYGLHPLAVEDCLSTQRHAPKVDEFSDHLFIVVHAFLESDEGPEPEELDAFLGKHVLITYQDRRIPATTHTEDRLKQGLALRPGTDGLYHNIVDVLTDEILPQVHALSDALDAIEDRILSNVEADGHYNRAILELRTKAGLIRRLLTPQLNLFQRLSRGEFDEVEESNRIYFRDIYDHLARIDLGLETLREDTEVALNTYLSVVNNRMNEVMKVLSVVGAIALPAVVIAGVFGTNFDNVPGLHSNWGFSLMMSSMGACAVGMAIYFKRKRWW